MLNEKTIGTSFSVFLLTDPIELLIKRAVNNLSKELEAIKLTKSIEYKKKQKYQNRIKKREILYLKLKAKGRKM